MSGAWGENWRDLVREHARTMWCDVDRLAKLPEWDDRDFPSGCGVPVAESYVRAVIRTATILLDELNEYERARNVGVLAGGFAPGVGGGECGSDRS